MAAASASASDCGADEGGVATTEEWSTQDRCAAGASHERLELRERRLQGDVAGRLVVLVGRSEPERFGAGGDDDRSRRAHGAEELLVPALLLAIHPPGRPEQRPPVHRHPPRRERAGRPWIGP